MQLAEVNVARLRAPLDSPAMSGLVKSFDDVMWLADRSPGFVWRHHPAEGDLLVHGELGGHGEVAVTLSVWEDVDALRQFVFRTAHGLFMRRRAQWFVPLPGHTTALWWVPDGRRPSVPEALARLAQLREQGPTPHAFSLRQPFAPDQLP